MHQQISLPPSLPPSLHLASIVPTFREHRLPLLIPLHLSFSFILKEGSAGGGWWEVQRVH